MGARGEAAEIKAVIRRAVGKGLGEIGIFPGSGRGTIGPAITKSQVPLAHHAGGVALGAKQGGKRGSIRLDYGIALYTKEHPVLESVTPRITPSKETVAGWRAARGRRVGIGETHAHAGQSIYLWRVELGFVAILGEVLIGARIAHPHVIGHHKDNIGRLGSKDTSVYKHTGKDVE